MQSRFSLACDLAGLIEHGDGQAITIACGGEAVALVRLGNHFPDCHRRSARKGRPAHGRHQQSELDMPVAPHLNEPKDKATVRPWLLGILNATDRFVPFNEEDLFLPDREIKYYTSHDSKEHRGIIISLDEEAVAGQAADCEWAQGGTAQFR